MPKARRPPGLWTRIRRLLGLKPEQPPPPLDPPDDEPALVPAGPPRTPRPAGSVELEIPDEPQDLELRG